MELTKYQKYWIYKKIIHFYKKDACFKHFNSELIFSNFYSILLKSKTFKQLIKNLSRDKHDTILFLPRKVSSLRGNVTQLYFEYPKLSFQIHSLVECWGEICYIQKNFSNENLNPILNEEGEGDLFDLENLERIAQEYPRFCYGNKPNYQLYFDPSLSSDIDLTIAYHERNLGLPLQVSFTTEYNLFYASVINKSENITKSDEKEIIVIQADIEAFYHKLELKFLSDYFKKSSVLNNKNIVKWIDILRTEYAFKSLPIGWVLSGFIANILLIDINKRLSSHIQEILKDYPQDLRLSKKITDPAEVYSYVDDFIFLIPVTKQADIDVKALSEYVLNSLNAYLRKNYSDMISFHSTSSSKYKYFKIDKFTTFKLKRNFHDMKASIPPEMEFGLGANDFLAETDPNLVINEKNQFSIELTSAKRKLASGQEISLSNIKELLNNIREKTKNTEGKYIWRVISTFSLILERAKYGSPFEGDESNEIELLIYENIELIFKILFEKNGYPLSEWSSFFLSLTKLVINTSGDRKIVTKYFTALLKSKNDHNEIS
ncbi:reverse transcriptase domain-containing protein, partial [Leptospira wolffii]